MQTNVQKIEIRSTHPTFPPSPPQWYWVAKARNGEIVAWGELHTRKEDAIRAAVSVFPGIHVFGETGLLLFKPGYDLA